MAVAATTVQGPFRLSGDANLEGRIVKLEPDNSWLAAGEVIAITGMERIEALLVYDGGGGYVWRFTTADQKLLAYYGDYSEAADGALVAVPDTTDLSALDLYAVALGQ